MKELPTTVSTADQSPVQEIVDLTFPPLGMDRAHAKAQEYEDYLNEIINSSEEVDTEGSNALIAQVIDELDATCGHMHEKIVVNGPAFYRAIDVTTIRRDDDNAQIATEIETEVTAKDITAMSLGYKALFGVIGNARAVVLRHVASMDPSLVVQTESHGSVYQSGYLDIPVDGRADAQLVTEDKAPNVELLQACVPDLLEEIDIALLNESDISKQLRSLSRIKFNENPVFADRAGEVIREEIVGYINSLMQDSFDAIYYIAGSQDIIVPTEEGLYEATLKKFRSIGVVNEVAFSPVNGDNRITLSVNVPFVKKGLNKMFYVLNPRITLTETVQLLV
jgi:hypothetical protein